MYYSRKHPIYKEGNSYAKEQKEMIKLLKNHKAIVLLDQAIFSGTSFFITILLARILSMENFGVYAGYTLAIYLVVGGLGAFIIQPFQVLLGKTENKRQYTAFTFWFQLLTMMLLVIGGLIISLLSFYHFPLTVLCFAFGFLLNDFGRRLLLALNLPLQALLLDATTAFFLLTSLWAFYQFGDEQLFNLYGYFSLAYLPSLLLLWVVIKPFSIKKANALIYFTEHIKQGKWLFLTAISQWWSSNLFVVAAGIYLGAAALGALRLVQSLMGILNMVLQTFENYVLPQTAQKLNRQQSEGLSFLTSVSRKAGLLFLPILVISFVFAEPILVLAGGAAYASFAFVLQGMTLLYMLVFLSQPIRLLIRALLLNEHFFYGYLISLGFALLFGHVLLSNYGLIGALMGLATSQLLLMTYWTIVLQRKKIYLWKSFISF
jgi:O-antigen/teichoic acid export membrane protein